MQDHGFFKLLNFGFSAGFFKFLLGFFSLLGCFERQHLLGVLDVRDTKAAGDLALLWRQGDTIAARAPLPVPLLPCDRCLH